MLPPRSVPKCAMKFIKMQGCGNDYVYVDAFDRAPPGDWSELAVRVSDRHFGIGSDGLVLICPSSAAHARMTMFNADGSESEMCGNAIRCVAKYVYESGLARRCPLSAASHDPHELLIETGRGILSLQLEVDGAGRVERVRVDMGEAILEAARIPAAIPGVAEEGRIVGHPWVWGDEPWVRASGVEARVTCVSMGNPHAVFFCEDAARVPLAAIGPEIENHPWFPRRINVHFVQVHGPGEATMRTWERGSGITLACGTGASAVCVAGVLTGRTSRRLLAHLPGGDLELEWSEDGHVFKTGPAVEVYRGEWPDAPVATERREAPSAAPRNDGGERGDVDAADLAAAVSVGILS